MNTLIVSPLLIPLATLGEPVGPGVEEGQGVGGRSVGGGAQAGDGGF